MIYTFECPKCLSIHEVECDLKDRDQVIECCDEVCQRVYESYSLNMVNGRIKGCSE